MVGLWFARRWAEYLTSVATAVLLLLEVYKLSSKVSVLKLVTFVINPAIATYLLWAKRLFGLNGGERTEEERGRASNDRSTLEQRVMGPAATKGSLTPLRGVHDAETVVTHVAAMVAASAWTAPETQGIDRGRTQSHELPGRIHLDRRH
jgi:Predicted membrane protein (DUF2127)